jgi:hypothetical protein
VESVHTSDLLYDVDNIIGCACVNLQTKKQISP